jgi:hypothetical protein
MKPEIFLQIPKENCCHSEGVRPLGYGIRRVSCVNCGKEMDLEDSLVMAGQEKPSRVEWVENLIEIA